MMVVDGKQHRYKGTIPLAIASQIIYQPMLPMDRSFLHQRMPSGAKVKVNIVYGEPFWRADGLSGQSAAPGSPATVTINACGDKDGPGVLCVIIEGPIRATSGSSTSQRAGRRSSANW